MSQVRKLEHDFVALRERHRAEVAAISVTRSRANELLLQIESLRFENERLSLAQDNKVW